MSEHNQTEGEEPTQEKQCRICYDGEDAELGRLIRPCLCKGSISYVHVKCLDKWRNTRTSRLDIGLDPRFFQCGQCKYQYRYKRTTISGLATNPVVVGAVSAILFTTVVLLSSFVTTYLGGVLSDDPSDVYISTHSFYYSPFSVTADLVQAALRIIQDETGGTILNDATAFASRAARAKGPRKPPGPFMWFVRRFVLGLPVVAASSLVQLLSFPLMGPMHWLARYRANRRRENSRDMAGLVLVVILAVGAIRAIYKVYKLTETLATRFLSHVEDTILEVKD